MTEPLNHEEWQGRTDGLPWMHRLMISLLRVVPLWLFYAIMALVVPFYMIFVPKGYLAQYHFFRQRLDKPPLSAFCFVYANHFRFGQVIIDRFAAFAGHHFRFEVEGQDIYDSLSQGEEGMVQISSHTGCYELAGYSLSQRQKTLYALVFFGEAPTVMLNRARLFTPHGVEMVPVMPDMSHIFALNNALRDGNIVSIPGDRIFGSPKTITGRFMGADARFPIGPFQLVLAREVPAIAVFVMKKSMNVYHIAVRRLADGVSSGEGNSIQRRQERAQNLAQSYADALEAIVRQYPTQWFNYFEFWK